MTADERSEEPPPASPPEPEPGACCQSGCDPCVYDLYWQAVDRYEEALAEWKARLAQNALKPKEIDQAP
jgi:hypothetical protein